MEQPVDFELEQELEEHIREQRSSIIAIDEALESDPTNSELLVVKEELESCIKAAEKSVFQLKRARLLQELISVSSFGEPVASTAHTVQEEATRPDVNPISVTEPTQPEQITTFSEGSKCRFRHTNGRWYNGIVHYVEEVGVARVFFLSPTTEKMQICRFFLQQRCRFGGNCRQSHGMELPLHALRLFKSPDWERVSLGTTIFACDGNDRTGLWKQAELEFWDDELYQRAQVVFIEDGKKGLVHIDMLALSEHAEMSDDSSDSSSEDDDEDEEEEEDNAAIGILVPAGTQTDTATFANWEKHTRGIASKMMANMGFREGMGLGKNGQGQIAPIEARVLPPKQSLDFINEKKHKDKDKEGKETHGGGKKKTRGGKRSRYKKWAAAALAAKTEQDKAPDVFGIINQKLSKVGQEDISFGSGSRRTGLNPSHGSGRKNQKKEDRRSIVAHEDSIMEIRGKISKLEEMALRNRKEKAVYDGVNRRLEGARRALSEAEAAHASATNAVHSKEKEKKWLKF